MARESKQTSGRDGTGISVRASSVGATLCGIMAALVFAGCLNTQSTALEEQPAPLSSPADACRAAAAADGYTLIEIKNLREVSEGYWEADLVVQDPELRNLLGCRHSISGGFTEVVRLDE